MLYVVRFSFDQHVPGEAAQTGSFEILVEDGDAERAVEACRQYLTAFVQGDTSGALVGKVVVYIDDIIEVQRELVKPALVNYRVHAAEGFGEIINPLLDGSPQVALYGWGDPEREDHQEPFVTFEPQVKPRKPAATKAAKPAATKAGKPAATKAGKPAATKAGKPAATKAGKPAAKPAATKAAKPAASKPAAKPSKPATKSSKPVTPKRSKPGKPKR